jgi:outer membrane cobalamin receptor
MLHEEGLRGKDCEGCMRVKSPVFRSEGRGFFLTLLPSPNGSGSGQAQNTQGGGVYETFFLLITSFLGLISISLSLSAQEKEVTLETVVVTATRDVQEIRKVPANVRVIAREQIEQFNAQSTVDLLRNEVGVMVRDFTGSGKTVSVDIRGFGETGLLNTLVLVDGTGVNEIDLSDVDWTEIPLDQIDRVEILRGPGSVLYGDNAVGTVINIITKKPEKTSLF